LLFLENLSLPHNKKNLFVLPLIHISQTTVVVTKIWLTATVLETSVNYLHFRYIQH